jgi:hypothetical protein
VAEFSYEYDMSFTHKEFRLYLAGASGVTDYVDAVTPAGGAFYWPKTPVNDSPAWRIELKPEYTWAMPNTLLRMNRTVVRITLTHYTEQEATVWMDRFHLHYKRGGG